MIKRVLARLDKWARSKIIDILDRYGKELCWAELVMWESLEKPWSELWDIGKMGHCEAMGCPPYCGKCKKETA